MSVYCESEDYKIYQGKMQDVLSKEIEADSIDCIITDPPYELNFMNKGWDNSGVAFSKDTWEHCFKVLKRGGYLLAFGGSRTFHRIACAIEDAGFEIRDCIMWLYGSGFPKSNDIGLKLDKKNGIDNKTGRILKNGTGKSDCIVRICSGNHKECFERKAQNEWGGWGTQLKPAYEPIIVARKPFEGSLLDNIIKNRVGGLNIDECKVGNEKRIQFSGKSNGRCYFTYPQQNAHFETVIGRFPSNVITDGSEEVAKGMPFTNGGSKIITNKEVDRKGLTNENPVFNSTNSGFKTNVKNDSISSYGDSGSAMRYFYCAKASTKDRDDGLDNFEKTQISDGSNHSNSETARMFSTKPAMKKNIHPTVKPVELMQYLIRLVAPKGATILDCFMGSGSTGKAVMFENRERNANYKFVGIEMTEQYLPIAQSRIDYAKNKYIYDELKEKAERKEKGIQNIFDFMEE